MMTPISEYFDPAIEFKDVTCLPDKNFFYELSTYIEKVDSFLSGNICTYHNLVKNSILKQINSNENKIIKSELCYFKNLNLRSSAHRKR